VPLLANPSCTFALALLDIVAAADPDANPKSFDEVREVVAKVNLLGEEMKRTLLVLKDGAVGDLKKGRQNIE